MISANQIKFIKSLSVKKFREREGLFIAEGDKIVKELINSEIKVHSLYFIKDWGFKIEKGNKKNNYFEISEEELRKISLLENPNKVLAIAHYNKEKFELNNIQNNLILMLDDIQDPGNLGTIVRTADWFGIRNIICSEETVDAFNPKVVQASMGSLFRIDLFYMDLKRVLKQIKHETNLLVYGAVLSGENVSSKDLNSKSILLLGNESKGINAGLLEYVDQKISIPGGKAGSAESLNVAVAASVLCYEFFRKI